MFKKFLEKFKKSNSTVLEDKPLIVDMPSFSELLTTNQNKAYALLHSLFTSDSKPKTIPTGLLETINSENLEDNKTINLIKDLLDRDEQESIQLLNSIQNEEIKKNFINKLFKTLLVEKRYKTLKSLNSILNHKNL